MYEVYERLLKSKGLKSADVSRATGISPSTLADWKHGRIRSLKTEKLSLIAEFFGVSIEYLMTGKGEVYDVAAGDGRYNDVPEYIDDAYPHDSDYSYVRIHGDSMLPELRDGDVVTVHHQTETSPKDYTVVKIDGEKETIKMVEIVQDGVWLRALNKAVYPDKFYSIQEVMTLPITIIGKAVSVRRDL